MWHKRVIATIVGKNGVVAPVLALSPAADAEHVSVRRHDRGTWRVKRNIVSQLTGMLIRCSMPRTCLTAYDNSNTAPHLRKTVRVLRPRRHQAKQSRDEVRREPFGCA